MIKILFLIHDLGQGGAEKVLVNLVNNMDRTKFDISVTVLFGGGVNEQFLRSDIKFNAVWSKEIPGNSKLMKLMTPEQLHKFCVKEHYDIEVSYLEGPSARVVSGCKDMDTKLVSWIHCTMHSKKDIAQSFRSWKEAQKCYNQFDEMVFVSEESKYAFMTHFNPKVKKTVLYNTNDSNEIIKASREIESDFIISKECFNWCGVGRIIPVKAYDRMLRIQKKLLQKGYKTHLYILGGGSLQSELEEWCEENGVSSNVTFMGYQTNPYKYLAKFDLFVCSSLSEGFSTATTEALIVGTPVCTVKVSGMKELLGENNDYGIIVENNEEALFKGIKKFLDDPLVREYYRHQAEIRGKDFSTAKTVSAVENMFLQICGDK